MGITNSITRVLGCKTKDEEEGGGRKSPIHPDILHRRQTHYSPYGRDSSERSLKMLIFGSSIWNAVKVLLHKLRFVLYLIPSSTKITADPVLPIQNPASSIISTEPLLIHTTLISASDTFASVADLSSNDQELQCDDVLYRQQWLPEEIYSTNMKLQRDADPMLPIQNPESSIISTEPSLIHTTLISGSDTFASVADLCSNDQELQCENFDVLSHQQLLLEENYSTNMKLQRDDVIVSIPDFACSLAHSSVSDEMMCSAVLIQENPPRNVVPFPEVKMMVDKSMKGEKKGQKEEKVKIKSIFVVGEERWIKHYSSSHRILLVGDGDFSFSACLAVAFGCASNMIATSLDPEGFLKKNYRSASSNIDKLKSRESKVMHGVDATKLMNHKVLGHLKFDRIIFNFPYAGLSSLKNLPRESQLRRHRKLVNRFLKNAREMISANGEIHISHKINGFHVEFKLESIAASHRLRLIEAVNFDCLDYPGYNTKYGFGGDNNFNCNPSNTYKFGLKRIQL